MAEAVGVVGRSVSGFAGQLRAARDAHGWTQEVLAERAGLARSMIGQLEMGLKKPSLDMVRRMAATLGVSADYLLSTPGQVLSAAAGALGAGPWMGVDFDGTLAEYGAWRGEEEVGAPVATMVQRVKDWLSEGLEVRIFTARIWPYAHVTVEGELGPCLRTEESYEARRLSAYTSIHAVRGWTLAVFGFHLALTCVKDPSIVRLWDDRAIQVIKNTGMPVCELSAYA